MMESSLLYIQACQNGGQAHIALFEIGNSGHDLLIGGVAAGLLQLNGQVGQLLGMGGVVAHHVLHQSNQLLHGGVLALALAAAAAAGTAVGMGVLVALVMEMLVGVGMCVIVVMLMGMLVGVGNTVMGVLMGMGVAVLVVVSAANVSW